MTKPPSIVNFERCYIGAWIVGVLNTILGWRVTAAMMAGNPQMERMGPGFFSTALVVGVLFSALITFLLWYFVARRHSVVAKWLVTALFAFGLVSFLASLARGTATMPGLTLVLGLVSLILQGTAVYMLFRPDARVWFDEQSPLSRP